MRFTKRSVFMFAGALLFLVFAATALGVVALLKLAPPAKNWVQAAISGQDRSVRQPVDGFANALGSERAASLVRLGVDPSILAAVGMKKEFADLLNAVSTIPQLGALVRDGAYREALTEGVRQRVRSIMEIQVDQVSSPAVRDAITEVQAALRDAGATGLAAATVDARTLELLTQPEFMRLRQNVDFGRYLSRPQEAKEVD